MAGIECSPKIFDFRANGIPTGESVDFFDTLNRRCLHRRFLLFRLILYSVQLFDTVLAYIVPAELHTVRQ